MTSFDNALDCFASLAMTMENIKLVHMGPTPFQKGALVGCLLLSFFMDVVDRIFWGKNQHMSTTAPF